VSVFTIFAMSAAFNMIDRNHDGVITRAEFNQAMAGSVSYAAPTTSYAAAPTYAAPITTYAAPATTYAAPMPTYSAPTTYAAPAPAYATPQYSYPQAQYNANTGSVVVPQVNTTTGSVVAGTQGFNLQAMPAQGTISSGAYQGHQYVAQAPVTYPVAAPAALPTATSMVAYPQYTFQTGSYVAPQATSSLTAQQIGSALDLSNDGNVTQAEMKAADTNNDGKIDASEVQAAASKKKKISKKKKKGGCC
jgi:hypothetical protein